VLVAVKRDSETIIPHGDTILRSADDVVIYCKPESRVEMRSLFGRIKQWLLMVSLNAAIMKLFKGNCIGQL
jgi:NhaP-type Na+/H+ and K+/H+ antiporter